MSEPQKTRSPTKAQIAKDTQTLSSMYCRGEWDEVANFVAANPHVAIQSMGNTGFMPRTPFVIAAVASQSARVMRAFAEAGAPMEARDEYGRTALFYAISRMSTRAVYEEGLEMIDYLIGIGCRTDVLDDKNRSILTASDCDLPASITKMLVAAGVTVERIDLESKLPGISHLVKCVMKGRSLSSLENLKVIVKVGADVNPQTLKIEDSPLGIVLSDERLEDPRYVRRLEVANFLLEHGADLSRVSANGDSILFHAGSSEAAAWVLERQHGLIDRRNLRGQTPLMVQTNKACARFPGFMGAIEVIKGLISAGADLDAVDDQGPKICKTPRAMIMSSDIKELREFLASHEAATQARAALGEIKAKAPSP